MDVPANIEYERAILGSILLDNACWDKIGHRLDMQHFHLASHKTIWHAFQQMIAKNQPIDLLTIREHFDQTGIDPATIGGFAYMFSLTENLPRHLAVESYAEALQEKARLREILSNALVVAQDASQGSATSESLIERQASFLDGIQADCRPSDNPLVSAYSREAINDFMRRRERAEHMTGRPYGLEELDMRTDGMYPGEVTVIGARNGVGKSVFMLQAARSNCLSGTAVHLISLEMTRGQCLNRLWCTESGVHPEKIRKPRLSTLDEAGRVAEAAARISQWPLRIHDRAELKIDQICALLRLSIRKHGTKVFAVDYAQCVSTHEREIRMAVMKASRELTKIAKGEGVHLILLSQLKRTERGPDTPPHIGDLRETGQMGDDAHCVILLHRSWDDEAGRCISDGELIVPKQREGTTFVLKIRFNATRMKFESEI